MLTTYDDMSLISIVHMKANALPLIEASQSAGALFGIISRARGYITQSRKKLFSSLSMSPAMEMILMLAKSEHADNVVQTAISETGISRHSFGAVVSAPVTRVLLEKETVDLKDRVSLFEGEHRAVPQKNLRLITCICQKGKAETITRAAVEAGSTAPVILYGEGQGIRERLGLLRIAVNPEKEIINVIAGEMESFHIFDAMVEAGKLYTPGMGFISVTDIPMGYVNLHSTLSDSHTEATIEQIIKAIDDLKGSKNWRLSRTGFTSVKRPERKSLYDLVNLKVITRRGLGEDFIGFALASGARGATLYYANLIGSEKVKGITGMVINDEREIIDFSVTRDVADRLERGFREIIEENQSKNTFILEIPVPKALTYIE